MDSRAKSLKSFEGCAKLLGMELNTQQLVALRALDPDDEHVTGKVHPKTLAFLERNSMIAYRDDRPTLTDWGCQQVREYVAKTGNGPEDLKAMFRFG